MSRDLNVGRRDEAINFSRSDGWTHGGADGRDAWQVGHEWALMWVAQEAQSWQEITPWA